MYCLIFAFDVQPEQREAFRVLGLQHEAACLRDEPGTLHFQGFQDEEDENRFYVYESYADREAADKHINGPIMQQNWPLFESMLAAPPIPLGRGFDTASVATRPELADS